MGPQDDPGLYRVFEHGKKDSLYYSVHGQNASNVARFYFSTSGVIKEDLGLKFVTFTANKFRHILRDLLEQRQSRVELYRGSAGSWKLAKRGSPGNLRAFEDMVDMSAKESAPALALMLGAGAGGAKRVGVAFAENGANLIRTVEFDDDEQFSQLETCVPLPETFAMELTGCDPAPPPWRQAAGSERGEGGAALRWRQRGLAQGAQGARARQLRRDGAQEGRVRHRRHRAGTSTTL